jgi:hypothetical protein
MPSSTAIPGAVRTGLIWPTRRRCHVSGSQLRPCLSVIAGMDLTDSLPLARSSPRTLLYRTIPAIC